MKKLEETPSWVIDYNHQTESRRIPGRLRIQVITNVPPVKKKGKKAV